MMFYKKVRIYYKIPYHSAEQPGRVSGTGKFIVHVDQGERRFYLSFISSSEFQQWYVTLAPHEKTMNEVVVSNNRKLIIDIDHPDSDHDQSLLLFYDFERHVTSRIHDVFMTLGIGKPEIIVYDICNDDNDTFCKISYHVVVTNFVFSAETCMGLCMIISSGQVWDKCVDTGVYKKIQCARIEDSTKFGENRRKHRIRNSDLDSDLNLNLPFSSGLLSDFENTTESHVVCNIKRPLHNFMKDLRTEISEAKNIDFTQFKIGKYNSTTNLLPLYRIKPGFCFLCKRVHDRENAAIKYRLNIVPTYICWRKT